GLRALADAGGTDGVAGGVTAVGGPSAGPGCYEGGGEVHAAPAASEPPGAGPGAGAAGRVRGGGHADLWAAADARLRAAGVSRVLTARECTICAPDDYFSHRRDAGTTGRQAGMTWLS